MSRPAKRRRLAYESPEPGLATNPELEDGKYFVRIDDVGNPDHNSVMHRFGGGQLF